MTKEISLNAITEQGFLPLFYYDNPQVCLEVVKTLYQAGVRVIEFTNRGPLAIENLTYLKRVAMQELPGLQLGIGTVKNKKEAEEFLLTGCDFIVSPIVDMEVAALAEEAGKLWIPGCFTPTEINLAHQRGAALIKIFPAQFFGPDYISSIKEVFAGQLFMPTGGVEMDKESISRWFKAGVCAVGVGSKLISKEVLHNKDYRSLYEKTVSLIDLVKSIK